MIRIRGCRQLWIGLTIYYLLTGRRHQRKAWRSNYEDKSTTKVRRGRGKYLLAGMGDRHRASLQASHPQLADEWHKVVDYMEDSNRKSREKYDAIV